MVSFACMVTIVDGKCENSDLCENKACQYYATALEMTKMAYKVLIDAEKLSDERTKHVEIRCEYFERQAAEKRRRAAMEEEEENEG